MGPSESSRLSRISSGWVEVEEDVDWDKMEDSEALGESPGGLSSSSEADKTLSRSVRALHASDISETPEVKKCNKTFKKILSADVVNERVDGEPRVSLMDRRAQAIRKAGECSKAEKKIFHERNFREVRDADAVREKLAKEFKLAQDQLTSEVNIVGFKRLEQWEINNLIKEQRKVECFLVKEGQSTGVASVIGRRDSQEDAYAAKNLSIERSDGLLSCELTAVFDGHSSRRRVQLHDASELCKDNVSMVLGEMLKRWGDKSPNSEVSIWNALKLACVDLDCLIYLMEKRNNATLGAYGGTTANIALTIDNVLWVANVGDSRAILVDKQGCPIALSEDAKPTDDRYAESVRRRDGFIYGNRVNSKIAVARAIGDHRYLGALNPRPKIIQYPLSSETDGCLLIQFCDGVSDVASSRQVAKLARDLKNEGCDLADIACHIVAAAYKAGSKDNLTVVVRELPTTSATV